MFEIVYFAVKTQLEHKKILKNTIFQTIDPLLVDFIFWGLKSSNFKNEISKTAKTNKNQGSGAF